VPPKPPLVRVAGWTPPPLSMYKVNLDGAVFLAQKATGVGVLIRNSHSQVVAVMSKKNNAPLGALVAKAKAFEVGL